MSETNKYHLTSLILSLTISFPISFYLMYKVLRFVNATELMMFLFWIYLPVTIIIHIISKIADMNN